MMADLVDDDVGDELLEAEARRLPFGEDRPAVERDPLGQHARMLDALPIERNAFVKPAELHRMTEAEAARGVGVGDFLDQQDDRRRGFPRRATGSRSSVCRAIASMSAALGIRPARRSAGVMADGLGTARYAPATLPAAN